MWNKVSYLKNEHDGRDQALNLLPSDLKSNIHFPHIPTWQKSLFFCIYVNWPLLPHFKPNIPLNSADGIKAKRANQQ